MYGQSSSLHDEQNPQSRLNKKPSIVHYYVSAIFDRELKNSSEKFYKNTGTTKSSLKPIPSPKSYWAFRRVMTDNGR